MNWNGFRYGKFLILVGVFGLLSFNTLLDFVMDCWIILRTGSRNTSDWYGIILKFPIKIWNTWIKATTYGQQRLFQSTIYFGYRRGKHPTLLLCTCILTQRFWFALTVGHRQNWVGQSVSGRKEYSGHPIQWFWPDSVSQRRLESCRIRSWWLTVVG